MWKIGDKIKFVKEGILDSTTNCGLTINKIYTIIKVQDRVDPYHVDTWNKSYSIYKNDMCYSWWIEPNCFKLIDKPKTEVDFLDCFKENFKEGV